MNNSIGARINRANVKNRLGIISPKQNVPLKNLDLRLRLNTNKKTDARQIIASKHKKLPNSVTRDARLLLTGANRKQQIPSLFQMNQPALLPQVPFIIPMKTVKNNLFRPASQQIRPSVNSNSLTNFWDKSVIRQRDQSGISGMHNVNLKTIGPLQRTFQNRPVSSSSYQAQHPAQLVSNLPLSDISGAGSVGLSPLQGFRVSVRNLASSVSLDDVHELFGSLGRLRCCQMPRPGCAEVVFDVGTAAQAAVARYHGRELDGRPMRVVLLTPAHLIAASSSASSGAGLTPGKTASQISMLQRRAPSGISQTEIDSAVVHAALFSSAATSGSAGIYPSSRRPVDFNINLS